MAFKCVEWEWNYLSSSIIYIKNYNTYLSIYMFLTARILRVCVCVSFVLFLFLAFIVHYSNCSNADVFEELPPSNTDKLKRKMRDTERSQLDSFYKCQ